MATRSRTYLPTDWTLWAYTPVAGKFRLDFSILGGSDVLGGSTDTGSIQAFPLRIGSIQLDDGQRPDQSVFSSFTPGTMALSAQLLTWSDTTVKELYNGKQVFLTLKNEATNSHPTFGKNTIFFIGQIDSLNIQVDPINKITNLTITATDISSQAANVPIGFTKTSLGKDIDVTQAFTTAKTAGQINAYNFLSLLGMTSTYETTGTTVATFGELMQDFIASDVCLYKPTYFQNWLGSAYELGRNIGAATISITSTNGELIPESIISGISIGQDGGNVPQSFDLSNSGANYTIGLNSASIMSNPVVYTSTIDVPTAFLPTIASKILSYTQKIQPVEITVRSAQAFQTIIFDNNEGDYIWPRYFWRNGQEVKTTPSYTGGTYYHQVVGTSHTITPDDWQTTYQLWKGLDAPVLPTNFVNNGSATSSSDLANWYGVSRTTAQFNTTPASWSAPYDIGSGISSLDFYKPSALTLATAYSLSFYAKNGFAGQTLSVTFSAGTATGTLSITPTTTGWTYYKIENITCAGNTTLDILITANDLFYVDDVYVVSGSTAY